MEGAGEGGRAAEVKAAGLLVATPHAHLTSPECQRLCFCLSGVGGEGCGSGPRVMS